MSSTKHKNISLSLRSKGKSSEEFENMLSALSMEEVLALKLELSAKMTNGKLFGIPILKGLQHIIREAAILFAHSAGKTNNEAASILGITNWQYRQLMKKYKIREFFKKSD